MAISDKEFLEELKKHPGLKDKFKEILAIAAYKGPELVALADEAEMQVTKQTRQLGKETLQNWADSEAARVSNNIKLQMQEAKKHVKKNSAGIPPTEK